MELSSPERKDEGARASSSPSCEADDGKELPNKQQRVDDDEGTRQPYKCTFCRRGFPTAQALGGHMNVHRRHRGRPAAAASTATAAAGTGSSASVYDQPCSTTTPPSVLAFAQHATHPAAPAPRVASLQRKPHELPLFGRGDCAAAGRSSGSGTAEGDAREDRFFAKEAGDGGEELDLELRLGGSSAGS